MSTGAAGVPPECHPKGLGNVAQRLATAAEAWDADGNVRSLRQSLLALLVELDE